VNIAGDELHPLEIHHQEILLVKNSDDLFQRATGGLTEIGASMMPADFR
jgi:hypothetical protein